MLCAWHAGKERINLRKHGLSLRLAEEALDDPNAFIAEDFLDDNGELRYQALAMLEGRLVLIAFVYRTIKSVNLPWVISLRKATNYEQEIYLFNRR